MAVMSDEPEEDSAFEYNAHYVGPCTCKPDCPSHDDPDAHGWGSCQVEGCECEAGWEE